MIIIYYLLFPLLMLVLGVVTSWLANLLTMPISFPISYLYKENPDNDDIQSFRLDFAITSIVHGVMLVFVLKWITSYMEIEIAFWYWIVCFIIKTYSDFLVWKRHKSVLYNLSVTPPKFIGYVIGLGLFVW
jgi:hypothetical protein